MSNAKNISIVGTCPFNTNEFDDLNNLLGQLNAPTIGIRITWGECCGYVPNAHGGKTAMYPFTVNGIEAVHVGWLNRFMRLIVDAGGTITEAAAVDIDNNQALRLTIPEPAPA